ncbi:MAG: DUF5317 domain-containing protein [Gudongella sp.]|jgi:hypothetical protein|nr:DUF5317 domain-containing protein [Gudongella sp.]
MFLEPAILSILIAKLRKGSIKNLADITLKGYVLFIAAALLQASFSLTKLYGNSLIKVFVNDWFLYLILFSYLLMIITILLNWKKSYMKLFLIGLLLNVSVIAMNNGKMPVSLGGISGIRQEIELPERNLDIKHVAVGSDTRLVWLADIIVIPKPYPLPKIISIGDVFIMGGVFLFFQREMLKYKSD